MKINTEDACLCGHIRYNHFDNHGFCYLGNMFVKHGALCSCGEFKLDNLRYLELLDKERK